MWLASTAHIGVLLLLAKPGASTPPASTAPPAAVPPPGYVELFVAGVMPGEDGHTLFLNDAAKTFFIPVGIGQAEAFAIHLRQERRRYERPLTHDLLDAAIRELGGRVEQVRVDDLKTGVFVGTVHIRTRDRLVELDARPSDAIALALGNRVPIYVAQVVIDKAAIRLDAAASAPPVHTPGDVVEPGVKPKGTSL